ncbi:MAG TPA: VWA domain-containing protein [Bryobacteraceae bacterium]|nr:VWA domain-containing protein [Bryobacteraceae bacterium]
MDVNNRECRGTSDRLPTRAPWKRLPISLGLILLTVLPCFGQKPDIRVRVPLIIAPTTVVDMQGQFVNGLKTMDFTLFDNGRPQRISDDVAFQPISLVIAVQCGGNVRWALPKIQRIASVVDTLVVGEGGEAALIAFDYRVRTLQPFTRNSRNIAAALEKLYASGSKYRLLDAMEAATDLLTTRPAGRRRILLLISESRDRGSETKLVPAITDMQAANISVYAVVMNHLGTALAEDPKARVPPPHAMLLDQPLLELFRALRDHPVLAFTHFTGGKRYSFLKQRSLEDAISAIGDEIHGQYLLSYVPDNQGQDGYHEIRVAVDRPHVAVRTRPCYWIAKAE